MSHCLRFGEPNCLTVLVEHKPPVDVVQGQIGWTNRARAWKSSFAYDWDWCTRLVPLGIWQSVYLLAMDEAWIEDVWVRPRMAGEVAQVEVHTRLRGVLPAPDGWTLCLQVDDPDGNPVAEVTFGIRCTSACNARS